MTDAVLPRKTFFSGFALPVFSWALPFHSLVIAMLFGGLGVSTGTVRALAAWKEAAVIGLVLLVMIRAMTGKGPRVAISWVDIAVGAMLFIAVAFYIAGNVWLRIELPRVAELYGLRDIGFFYLLYFVGRASPEIADDPDTLRRLYIIAVLTSAIAIVEWFLVTPEKLVLLGVAAYLQDFLNVSAFTTGNEFGLPLSYWTRIGSVQVQRAGSVYLSAQAFAVPFLIVMPAATVWFFGALKKKTMSMRIEYGIIWLGLLLTITRMTIIVCVLQLLLIILMLRKPEWAVAGLATAVAVMIISFVAVPGLTGFVWDTLTWQTGSSASHLNDWRKGVEAFFDQPWGWGLGTTDMSAVRSGLEPLTADNAYLKYAVELGVEGLIAHLAIYVGVGIAAFKAMQQGRTKWRRLLGSVVLVTTVGIMINGATGVVFNALTLSYLYFWFAGAIVTITQQDAVPARAEVTVPVELATA